MEILRLRAKNTFLDLNELEHYENLKEVHLRDFFDPMQAYLRFSSDHAVKKAPFPMLKRCTHLRRLTLATLKTLPFPSSEDLCDFIMELNQLTYLHIIYDHRWTCDHFKSLVDEVEAFVLPRRPNFKFYVSCCKKLNKRRVPDEFFPY